MASWLLGYPQAALADTEHALNVAREIGHPRRCCMCEFQHLDPYPQREYAAANALVDEFIALKDQTGSLFWGRAMTQRGCILALTGKAPDAVKTIPSRPHRNPIIGNNDVDAVVVFTSGKSQRGNRSI